MDISKFDYQVVISVEIKQDRFHWNTPRAAAQIEIATGEMFPGSLPLTDSAFASLYFEALSKLRKAQAEADEKAAAEHAAGEAEEEVEDENT